MAGEADFSHYCLRWQSVKCHLSWVERCSFWPSVLAIFQCNQGATTTTTGCLYVQQVTVIMMFIGDNHRPHDYRSNILLAIDFGHQQPPSFCGSKLVCGNFSHFYLYVELQVKRLIWVLIFEKIPPFFLIFTPIWPFPSCLF